MGYSRREKTHFYGQALLILAGVVVVSLLANFYWVLLHGEWHYFDDLLTIDQIRDLSYKDLFSSTLIGTYYYRPIILTLTKIAYSITPESAIVLRIGQVLLHLSSVLVFAMICKSLKMRGLAVLSGILCLAFSSHTFLRISYFSIGIGTYLVSFLFLLALWAIVSDKAGIKLALVLSILGLLTREQALVIPFAFFLHFGMNRKYRGAIFMVGLVAIYFLFRSFVMGQGAPPDFHCSSGWFGQFCDISELETKFGASPLAFYLYNVITHVLGLAIYLPWKGQYVIHDKQTLILMAVYFLSASVVMMVFWRRNYLKIGIQNKTIVILTAVILANAIIAYNYSRHRMMFLGGISFSLLFAIGLQYLTSRNWSYLDKFLVLCTFLGWCVFSHYSLLFINQKMDKIETFYLTSAEPKPGVQQRTHDMVRSKLLKDHDK